MAKAVAVLFSGGKDSTRAVHWCLEKGYEVRCLVTLVSHREDSYMFHVPNIGLTSKLAEAIGIKIEKSFTSGEKEKEVGDLKRALGNLDVDGVACGGIASNYQKGRIEKVCGELGLELIAPFWGADPERFMEDTIKMGFDVRFVGVYAEGLGKDWLGRKLDGQSLKELIALNKKYGVSFVGEGGEFETITLDGPIFKKRVEILDSKVVWDERAKSGHLEIGKVRLVHK
ncbi:TIGR00289 family protein [Candidatus Micrarchaeota archaeon RBG_16_49_10]|nr:MAG: TIGR00289 family protein [Candidatus Micrarchaeota archaeon RBG_16_49_10]